MRALKCSGTVEEWFVIPTSFSSAGCGPAAAAAVAAAAVARCFLPPRDGAEAPAPAAVPVFAAPSDPLLRALPRLPLLLVLRVDDGADGARTSSFAPRLRLDRTPSSAFAHTNSNGTCRSCVLSRTYLTLYVRSPSFTRTIQAVPPGLLIPVRTQRRKVRS